MIWLKRIQWLAFAAGWVVAVMVVVDEFCLAAACRDTAAFTIFGLNMGLFGIGYFTCLLVLQWLLRKRPDLEPVRTAMVFSGVGAELRLLWIQKAVIGAWCPFCVTICIALMTGAVAMTAESFVCSRSSAGGYGNVRRYVLIAAVMLAAGLIIASLGVKEVVEG